MAPAGPGARSDARPHYHVRYGQTEGEDVVFETELSLLRAASYWLAVLWTPCGG